MNKAIHVRSMLRSKAIEISRCQILHGMRTCILHGMRTQVVEKTYRGNLATTYSCTTFSVELRTCFEIDTSNDHR